MSNPNPRECVLAVLKSLSTKDGLITVDIDKAQIGKIYIVDILSTRLQRMFNTDHCVLHKKVIIDVWDEKAREWLWFPQDCLFIPCNARSVPDPSLSTREDAGNISEIELEVRETAKPGEV